VLQQQQEQRGGAQRPQLGETKVSAAAAAAEGSTGIAAAAGQADDDVDGKQAAEALFKAVSKQKANGRRDWWESFEPELVKK